jgi:hypothetical protein
MGNFISKQKTQRNIEKETQIKSQLQKKALILYQYREKQYNFYIHGSFDQYMRDIAYQYEMDCLSDDCNYRSTAKM